MSTLYATFPYSPDAEPTEDWTVEQVAQYCLLEAHRGLDARYENLKSSLDEQFENGKESIWQCHKDLVKSTIEGGSSGSGSGVDGQQQRSSDSCSDNALDGATTVATEIHISIVQGFHAGVSLTLKPKLRAPCWVGRSQGKKFRDRGISLPKDPEISTTHGKFEVIRGCMYYTDTGSTNGSKVGNKLLEPDAPLALGNGTELIVGQSVLRITLS